MIIDELKHAASYYGLSPRLEAALRYLERTDFSQVATGRYEIEGDAVFALVQEYQTKPREQGAWEAHRRYLDVQYVVSGAESMGFAAIDRLQAGAYDAERDFVKLDGDGEFVKLRAGSFVVLAPQDAHMPGMAIAGPLPVKKVVVKVRA
ncbi:MAG: YhcH/YjgK/YiaL family protein [Candidatus Latescibacterota bacterium]